MTRFRDPDFGGLRRYVRPRATVHHHHEHTVDSVNLKEHRVAANLTQRALADLLKVHEFTIGTWERGQARISDAHRQRWIDACQAATRSGPEPAGGSP